MSDTPAGMQEVTCHECGEHLGYQAADTLVQREMWRHNQCPMRIARQLGMVRTEYETALAVTAVTINGAYPDVSNGLLRAHLAAGGVLEALSAVGYTLIRTPR